LFGNITDEKYYDSNGNITTNPANTIKSPIRYGEYQYDSETEYTDAQGNFVTGLYYLNARHYDPGTASFLEIDTYTGNISDPLSLNLYSYCRNEPIMYTDPTTINAVNAFKNPYLPSGNTVNNVGKVGDTTWLYIKREVKLKNLEPDISLPLLSGGILSMK
jgi:RHS repeat-associated protein